MTAEMSSCDLLAPSEPTSTPSTVDVAACPIKASHIPSVCDEEDHSNIKFSPPLYRQRYQLVADVLRESRPSSVVDFGCAECHALQVFRSITGVHRLVGVDIDRQVLVANVHKLNPLVSDFVFRRTEPLSVEVYEGNLCEFDERLKDIDAITLIEVIEHLPESELSAMPSMLFGCMKPQLVVMTTPNADFNVLFPDPTAMRHPDHKFEWTRQEFQQWCNSVASQYQYSVTLSGVGEAPEHMKHVGCCSQVAVFKQLTTTTTTTSAPVAQLSTSPYQLVYSVEYPVYASLSGNELILQESQYYINLLAQYSRSQHSQRVDTQHSVDSNIDSSFTNVDSTVDLCIVDRCSVDRCSVDSAHVDTIGVDSSDVDSSVDCGERSLISLEQVLSFPRLQQLNVNIEQLRCLLLNAGYTLSPDELHVIYDFDYTRRYSDDDLYGDDDLYVDDGVYGDSDLNVVVDSCSDLRSSSVVDVELWD